MPVKIDSKDSVSSMKGYHDDDPKPGDQKSNECKCDCYAGPQTKRELLILFDEKGEIRGTASRMCDINGCEPYVDGERLVVETARVTNDRITFFPPQKDIIMAEDFSGFDPSGVIAQADREGTLRRLANFLQEHQEIGKLRIEGHAQDSGDLQYDIRLSVLMARGVRDTLIKHGVDPNRLEAEGYGAMEPIVEDPSDKLNLHRNTRVEFKILK